MLEGSEVAAISRLRAVTVKYTGVPFFRPVTVTLESVAAEAVPSSTPSEAR